MYRPNLYVENDLENENQNKGQENPAGHDPAEIYNRPDAADQEGTKSDDGGDGGIKTGLNHETDRLPDQLFLALARMVIV